MSLTEALLLDPLRMNVYIAARTDGVAGSGTQNDPFDGSTQAKFDSVMSALPMRVASITNSASTATVTAISHGYANGNLVLIDGVTGTDGTHYNGPFTISAVSGNTFQYTTANGAPSGPAAGIITCRFTSANGPMVSLGVSPPLAVRLGPGTFQTNGYADGVTGAAAGWQARPAMKITGSGIDVTVLQLAASTVTGADFYAIGHPVPSASPPNLVDYFEACDFTIDSNLAGQSGVGTFAGAVRIMGNHAKVRRLKLVNWGTKSSSAPGFVICMVTASTLASVEDCGIEDCLAISPASASGAPPVTVFHAGGQDTASVTPLTIPLAYGIAPYIRNCFVDPGETSPFTPEVRGYSMAWCKAGIIEGNQAHNLTYGVFQQLTAAQDIVIRNNWFKNVNKGIFLGNTGATSGAGSLNKPPGLTATVTILSGHNVYVGDSVLLNTTGAYNGLVVQVLSSSYSSTVFQFSTSNSASADTVNSVQRAFGVSNATIEGNVVELAPATSGSLISIHADDSRGTAAPASYDATYPNWYFNKMVVRDNKLRYLDGGWASNYVGYGIQLDNVGSLQVRNNVIESAPATPPPMQNNRCGAVTYFNNLKPDGTLIQGVNGDNGSLYEELATLTDFALIMGLFNKKA